MGSLLTLLEGGSLLVDGDEIKGFYLTFLDTTLAGVLGCLVKGRLGFLLSLVVIGKVGTTVFFCGVWME